MFLLFDAFQDRHLTAFEELVLGVHPTMYLDRHLLSVWANELFSFCYLSYYFMIPVFVLALYFRKKQGMIRSFLTAACLTFFLSYLLFFLYPVEGPRWYFSGQYVNQIDGPVFRKLVNLVIDKAAVHGGCMPSSHFAVALVILMYCFRYFPKTTWILTPLVAGLGIGTVWGRFHYVSDVVVGGIIGLLVTLTVWAIYPPQKLPPGHRVKHQKLEVRHAS